MTKMNNAMRRSIEKRIVEKLALPRDAAFRHEEQALATRLIRQRYGDDIFERCRALPEGWLRPYKMVTFGYQVMRTFPRYRQVYGRHDVLEPKSYLNLVDYAPLPCSMDNGWSRDDCGPLYDAVYDLFQRRVDFETEIANIRRQIAATLASFSTVERLAEGWPEGYAELPQEALADDGKGLPAPRIADLNERIAALKEAA